MNWSSNLTVKVEGDMTEICIVQDQIMKIIGKIGSEIDSVKPLQDLSDEITKKSDKEN